MCDTTKKIRRTELLVELGSCLEDYHYLLHEQNFLTAIGSDYIIIRVDESSPLTEWYRYKNNDETLVPTSERLYTEEQVSTVVALFAAEEELRREFKEKGE